MRHRRSAATNRKLATQDARRLYAQARATHDPVAFHQAQIAYQDARTDARMPAPLRAVLSGPVAAKPATTPRDTAPLAYGDRPFSLFR